MADSLGPIAITDPPVLTSFPLTVDWGGGLDFNPNIAIHTFEAPGLKTEQRFVMGSGTPRLRVRRNHLNRIEYDQLKAHYTQAQGQYASFPIPVAGPKGMETWNVRYENPALAFDHITGMLTSDPGLTFVVIPDPLAPYTSVAQVNRFPDSTFEQALAGATQHVYPLVMIQDKALKPDGSFLNPAAYISNQRVIVDGHTYLPRLSTWNGITQTLSEASDSAQFTFGNADDAFTKYANTVNLYRAIVQFSLYHAESGYLCYLWGGYAQQWSLDTSGKFTLPCSSGTFELTLGYPLRNITRTCWKVYKGRFCPSTASFPDCPKSFQACIDRGVQTSFGGLVVPQQAITVKDNSTGVLGFGKSSITSLTIVADTIYQNALPEVWTDTPMKIDAMLAGGRDESDYYAAIGIASDGPIGAFNPNLMMHDLDGQVPMHPLENTGWRAAIGNDPADTVNDYMGISQAPWTGPSPGATYSAGLAFAEIRRIDSAGLQLSPLTEHKMTLSISQGTCGWVWDGPGARRWVTGLTNCVWVAVNVYLRALGLRVQPSNASHIPASKMEQYFDVNQAIYSAAICDLVVNKLVPADGTQETQFPFRAILKERKAVKDWLTEILNCCLGYWTFANGKLWIGIRENASAKDAFTQDHIKFKTLQVLPLKPNFNWLTAQFGDEEFEWQLNNVTVYDIDHGGMVGTPESPSYLTSNMNLVGVSNLSQASRVATTRLREEIGGYVVRDPTTHAILDNQLQNARHFSFQTTILALKNIVGDVISLTHPMLPKGFAKGRIRSWTLNPDFSIDISAACVTNEMYDLDFGPKPDDVAPLPLPQERRPSPLGLAWMPNLVGPIASDPLYPDPAERTFALWQDYFIAADGSWAPALFISGYLTINTFIDIHAPVISSVALAAGGQLPDGHTVYFGLTVRDAKGQPSAPARLAMVWIPKGTTGRQANLTFMPPVSGTWDSWDLYAGLDPRSMSKQYTGTGVLPASYSFLGPVHPNTEEMPDRSAQYVQIGVKHVIHSGIAGVLVNSVVAPNKIQSNDFIGSTDVWVGRMVSAIADETTGHAPLLNYEVMAFDAASGTLTVAPNCVIPGQPDQSVEANDVLIVRSVVDNISPDGLTIGDPGWNNSVGKAQSGNDPTFAGLAPDAEIGNIARVIRGAGQGQYAKIVGNDNTHITLARPFAGVGRTSIVIIEEPNWADVGTSSPLAVGNSTQIVQVRIPVDNLANVVGLVGGFLNDGNGHLTDEAFAIFREVFIWGQPPSVRTVGPAAGPWLLEETDQTVNVASEQNDVILQLPPLAVYAGRTLLIFNVGTHHAIVNTATIDGTQEKFYDGSVQQVITKQGGSLRITSAGDYIPLSLKRKLRHERERNANAMDLRIRRR